ncbi:MAG: hypothetical protein KAJ44_01220 [Thermoplasmatales archaeon]|nr:hypothetical protein [Thermoplasmatales archaeon]
MGLGYSIASTGETVFKDSNTIANILGQLLPYGLALAVFGAGFVVISIKYVVKCYRFNKLHDEIIQNKIVGKNKKEICKEIFKRYIAIVKPGISWGGFINMTSKIKKSTIFLSFIGIVIIGIIIYLVFQNLQFLNSNSGALTVIFSGLVAIATIVYAILTWKIVSLTKMMREPKVIVDFQPREEWINFLDIIIQNIGETSAYDIKFKIDPDFEYMKGKFLSELNYMKGINYLPPKKTIRSFITSMAVDTKNKQKPFEIEVSYITEGGKPKKETFRFDFSQLLDLSQLGESPIYKISDNLETISKAIENFLRGNKRLRTEVYTKKEVEKEKKEKTERAKKMIEEAKDKKKVI